MVRNEGTIHSKFSFFSLYDFFYQGQWHRVVFDAKHLAENGVYVVFSYLQIIYARFLLLYIFMIHILQKKRMFL